MDFPGFSWFCFIFLEISWLFWGFSSICPDFLGFPLFLFDFHTFFIDFLSRGDARELREFGGWLRGRFGGPEASFWPRTGHDLGEIVEEN